MFTLLWKHRPYFYKVCQEIEWNYITTNRKMITKLMIPMLIAIMAPIVNSIQLFPQLYKTYTTKSVKDLSFYSLLLILTTNILWLLHGYFIYDVSLLIAGTVSLCINLALLLLYLRYQRGGISWFPSFLPSFLPSHLTPFQK